MAHDTLRKSTLIHTIADLLGDFSDLVQKEIRLARAEISENLTSGLQAGVWLVMAGLLGILAVGVVVEAIVFALTNTFGLALHWSCLIVAAILLACSAAAFAYGRSKAKLIPTRSIRQISEAVTTAKEQLT